MKRITSALFSALALFSTFVFQSSGLLAQSTAFTYQGRLDIGGAPASGFFDLTFGLWTSALGPSQVGDLQTNNAVPLSNGVFTVTLNFGDQFPGAARWLEIAVRTNGDGDFTLLAPRQLITSAPYAIKASGVDAAGIAGTISPAIIGSGTFDGSFSGSGAGLTNLVASQLSGAVPTAALANAWTLTGNAGTISGTHFVGTTDTQPLELRVNTQRVLRLERDTNSVVFGYAIPNIIGGHESNLVAVGVGGATIAGGGGPEWYGPTAPHEIDGAFSTIGGGVGNIVQGVVSTIAGGERGFIGSNAYNSFVGGGAYSSIEAADSALSGGRGNAIRPDAYASVIGGGSYNVISTNAQYSVIPGGANNKVGLGASYAFAAGNGANANHAGAFVWADSQSSGFSSTANNQFLIRATGGVGIGTASPGAQLEVRTPSANANAIRFGYTSAGGTGNLIAGLARVAIATDDLVERFVIRQGSGNVGIGLTGPSYQLQLAADSAAKPNGGSWANTSDARLKRNIMPLADALTRLLQLRGVTFEWVNPEDHANQRGLQGGFLAQEVEAVFPNWITEVEASEHDRALTDNGKVKSLSLPFEFDALVVEAIKEQQTQLRAAKEEIKGLKRQLAQEAARRDADMAELRQHLAALEQESLLLKRQSE